MKPTDCDVAIVGAGVVGLATAAVLSDSGFEVVVLESSQVSSWEENRYDLRVNSINLASQAFLDSLEVWPRTVAKRVSRFDHIKVWSSIGGRIEFKAAEIEQPYLGHIVESSALIASLLETLEDKAQVSVLAGTHPKSISHGHGRVTVALSDNGEICCRLLVGADGANSIVRELLGIQTDIASYEQTAIVAKIDVSISKSSQAIQVFLPTGPLAFLPLADGTYSIVWSAERGYAQNLLAMSSTEFEENLASAVNYYFGQTRLVSEKVSFDLTNLRVNSYIGERAVLAGDAAHVIHPLAGMGVNLGLMDAAALGEVFQNDGSDPFNQSRLRRYERWRKSSNIPVGHLMDGFDRSFRHSSKLLQTGLGAGMTVVNRTHSIKQKIIRLACGLSGDQPKRAEFCA